MKVANVAERIRNFNSTRDPSFLSLKYKLMAESPFRFFRGSCHLFYEDLADFNHIPGSPATWLCGDLHLENFGVYKGDNRLVYFDLNDFDEAILGPAIHDLARITTSILLALDSPGGNHAENIDLAKIFLQAYSEVLSKGKARYIEQMTATGIIRSFLDKINERNHKDLVDKRTYKKGNNRALKIDDKKLFALEKSLKKELADHFENWIEENQFLQHLYKVEDAACRIAGTGSIGVKRYLFLLKRRDSDKYLLIDMKQAMPSSLHPFIKSRQPSWATEAERIAAIQYRMQNVPPSLLSSTTFKNDSYVVKEMQPSEDKIDLMMVGSRIKEISLVARDFALLTSSAQLRSSGRQGSVIADDLIAFGRSGGWQKAVLDYAIDYAEKVKTDYQFFTKEWKNGFFN
jgi:uncharacterized protein (DUF2252 family)